MNHPMKKAIKVQKALLLLPLFLAATSVHPLLSAPLVIAPGSTLRLGDPNQATSLSYDSLTVAPGGTLELMGQTTLAVEGEMVIDGTISSTPSGKAPKGRDGMDGANGADDQPTGKNVGLSGEFPGTAPGWTEVDRVPRLTLRAGGNVAINGIIRLEPALDGGDGGRGGNGGHGGSGISPEPGKHTGALGGGGSQGGKGAQVAMR